MLDADHLRIVFSVHGTSFVMPVADLLAIRGANEEDLTSEVQSPGSFRTGSLVYRETDVAIYDLAALFSLTGETARGDDQLLIFAGADCPWAVRVDHVAGVFDAALFELRELPTHLFRDELVPYRQVALHEGQLLVSIDARQIDRVWHRSG